MRQETRINAIRTLPKRARGTWAALCGSLSEQQQEQLIGMICDAYRVVRKAESDARTDGRRRVLVGARVPRALAERCRQAANREGISLYRWVIRALEKRLEGA